MTSDKETDSMLAATRVNVVLGSKVFVVADRRVGSGMLGAVYFDYKGDSGVRFEIVFNRGDRIHERIQTFKKIYLTESDAMASIPAAPPLTIKELNRLVGSVIVHKASGDHRVVSEQSGGRVRMGIWYTAEELLREYQHISGHTLCSREPS